MRNRIIQVRHYSRKMMIMMLTGAICCSSCFCQTAFAKTSKVRVYDAEKGTTSFTSFTYSDNKKDESLAPSEGTGAISSASQKVVIFHQADGSTIIRKADSNGKVTLPAIRNQTGYTFLGWSTKPDQHNLRHPCIISIVLISPWKNPLIIPVPFYQRPHNLFKYHNLSFPRLFTVRYCSLHSQ